MIIFYHLSFTTLLLFIVYCIYIYLEIFRMYVQCISRSRTSKIKNHEQF